ncbi:MAG: HD domain-containing protein [Nitrospirae bacterium]|nr:HD domain-containing protein [Nitrospirota bacterium]
MKDNRTKPKGKIIRDAVHGDIFISDNFLKIIDTPEFQRLRRIRQLSTANMLFPTAEHTRFSHSIGCYHVMQLLIEHFRPILKNINVKIDDVDIELSLAAALLHDIGHGPFSHAFENALPNTVKQKKHEDWTTAIITSSESRIQQVLVEHFEPRFPHRLAELLTNKRLI